MSQSYAPIRQLLAAAFNQTEFMIFCYDYFRPLYDELRDDMEPSWKIHKLVEYCDKRNQVDELLVAIRTENPGQYNRHIHLITIPQYPVSYDTSQIEIAIRINFREFTHNLHLAVVGALAGILNIRRVEVCIVNVSPPFSSIRNNGG
jgi:hypothetical protein